MRADDAKHRISTAQGLEAHEVEAPALVLVEYLREAEGAGQALELDERRWCIAWPGADLRHRGSGRLGAENSGVDCQPFASDRLVVDVARPERLDAVA